VPQLDAAAAREYQRFMAGARAMDVPMWDSHMVEDLPKVCSRRCVQDIVWYTRQHMQLTIRRMLGGVFPHAECLLRDVVAWYGYAGGDLSSACACPVCRQVSMKEMQRQTQKIRSAATEEERADMEDMEKRREMVEQQLSSQLAELSGAPLGRAAREAWRKEQQEQKQQQEQQRLAQQQAGGRSRGGSPEGSSSRGGADFNPFAVSGEARAKWDADDHLYSDPAPRKGSGFGGFGFGGGQRQQQPQQQSQQPQAHRRKFADEAVDTAALQPARSSSPGTRSSSGSWAGLSSQPEAPQQQQQPAAAADGPAEGTPEWEAAARAEMIKNAAARRARRQQMVQQQPAPQAEPQSSSQPQQSRGTGGVVAAAGAAASRSLPSNSSLHRPKWPGADTIAAIAAVAGAAADAAVEPAADSRVSAVRMQNEMAAAADAGGSRLAAAAAKDVREVIPAAMPTSGSMQRLQESAPPAAAAATTAIGAAAATPASRSGSSSSSRQEDEADDVNPFAVDRAAIIDDDTAYEIGKVVDEETKRIRLL
jgi:hypothetical protein